MSDFVSFLPWLGLVGGVLALFLREKGVEKGLAATSLLPLAFPPVVLAVAAAVGANFVTGEPKIALYFFAGGAAVSIVAVLLSGWRATSAVGSLTYALGLASFVAGGQLGAASVDSPSKLGGLVCGLACGALPAMGLVKSRAAVVSVLTVFAAGILLMISKIGYAPPVDQSAVLVCWLAILALTGRWGAEKAVGGGSRWMPPTVAVVMFGALVWVVTHVYLGQPDVAIVALASVAAVVVSAWAMPVGREGIVPWGMVSVIWLGLATFAFSSSFGLGMAVGALCGVLCALLINRADLLPAVGVLIGLSYYRLFREGNSEVVQAFDIGQHYALIGFVLGVIVLVALADGMARRRPTWTGRGHVAAAIVGLIGAVIVIGASTFFGTKGAIGLVLGLAVAPMVARLTMAGSPWTTVASAALQGAIIVVYRPLSWETDLDRDGKLKLLWYLGAGVFLLVIVLWGLDRKKKEASVATQ